VGKPGGEDAGFTGTCTGKHEKRAVERLHSGALFWIETLQIGGLSPRHCARDIAARAEIGWWSIFEIAKIYGFRGHAEAILQVLYAI
jgi:hypothetical protein